MIVRMFAQYFLRKKNKHNSSKIKFFTFDEVKYFLFFERFLSAEPDEPARPSKLESNVFQSESTTKKKKNSLILAGKKKKLLLSNLFKVQLMNYLREHISPCLFIYTYV